MIIEVTPTIVQPKRRIIAVGRSERGSTFVVRTAVQPPADFAEAVAEVLAPGRVATVPPVPESDEAIGEEFCRQPYLY